jgi:hypothetical protein
MGDITCMEITNYSNTGNEKMTNSELMKMLQNKISEAKDWGISRRTLEQHLTGYGMPEKLAKKMIEEFYEN